MMSPAPHPNQFRPGDLIHQYRIVRVIGTGGFSRVFLVEFQGRQYALKMATTSASEEDPNQVDGWLRREVGTLERLTHPHLLPAYELGRWPEPRTGYSFYVTDYVPGTNLRTLLRYSELNPSQWVGVVGDMLRALEALHEVGVVHRDLKAENVLVREEDGQVFLIDLGSAHLPGARPLTEGAAPGTLYCMPPEVVFFLFNVALKEPEARMEAHPAADLYGVGVILYETLTGQSPFDPKRPLKDLVPDILHKPPADPRQLNPRAPASLSELCLRLLAKEPQARPQSARAVREELERLQVEEGDTALWQTPTLPSTEPEPPPSEPEPAAGEEPPLLPAASHEEKEESEEQGPASPPGRWPGILAVLALGLVVLLALGWVLLHGKQGADARRTFLLAESTGPVLAPASRAEGAPPMPFLLDDQLSVVPSHPAPASSPLCTLLRRVLGGVAVAQLAGCATTPPPVVPPDPLAYLSRCSTEARITPRKLGFQPYDDRRGANPYWYPTHLESGTPASSQSVDDGGPVNIRSGPVRAIMSTVINGEEKEFTVTGEAFVTPSRVYIEIDRIQLPDGSWLPLCGVASAGDDKLSTRQFGIPTYAVEPLAVTPLDPALVDKRPGSVVLNDPRFETFVQPADPNVKASTYLRMPAEHR
jgi:eukaryotic-like serine/threonine-protein kinase